MEAGNFICKAVNKTTNSKVAQVSFNAWHQWICDLRLRGSISATDIHLKIILSTYLKCKTDKSGKKDTFNVTGYILKSMESNTSPSGKS